jgi:Flp pilus assembly protein TadG
VVKCSTEYSGDFSVGNAGYSKHFTGNTQGSVAIIFALCITCIFGGIALAIDLNMAANAGTKLAKILDAAALAGAKVLDQDNATDAQVRDRVQSFVSAQAPIAGIPASQFAKLTISIDRTTNTVKVDGAGTLPTRFAGVIGYKTMDIKRSASTTYKLKAVELALVLDTTGSMAEVPAGDTKTKIESLQAAATLVVDTLYAQAINERGIRIAIAPYTGTYASQVLPAQSAPRTSFFMSFANASSYDVCAVERTGTNNATDAGPQAGGTLRTLTSVGGSGNACPAASIIPLTGHSQQSSIKTTISNFSASGSTAGHIGAAWGWYMLSPNWNGIFSGANAPGAYNDPNVSKNLVLMTDGLFNTSYLSGLAAGSAAATTESYAQFDALCQGMKAKGINVYTIGFGLNDPTATAKLSGCASAPSNFFAAANGTELKAAFSTIVDKLNSLRVSR